MKKQLLLSTLLTLATGLEAQNTIRVDIDMTGRQTAEVTEPEFTRWESRKDFTEDTFETAGVSFRLASEHKMRGDYAKAFVQSKKDNCRLTGDGICLDPKDECGSFTLYIKGLATSQQGRDSSPSIFRHRLSTGGHSRRKLATLPSNMYVLKTTDTNGKRHNYKIIK